MPTKDPLILDDKVIRDSTYRCERLPRNFKGGQRAALETWGRHGRFWALRPSVFEKASGTPYAEVIRHQRENGFPFFDPHDQATARAKAIDLQAMRQDTSHLVLDKWHYWLHFPEVLRDVLELDVKEIQARIDVFDRELLRGVEKREAELAAEREEEERKATEAREQAAARRAQQEQQRAEIAARQPWENALMPIGRPRKLQKPPTPAPTPTPEGLPAPYRMRAHIVNRDVEGKYIGDHLRWTFEATHADTRGHSELVHPLMQTLWNLFRPYAIYNGLNADHRRGVFSVIFEDAKLAISMVGEVSRVVRAALEFDPAVVPPVSTTKAAKILKVSADDLRLLVEVQEITPQREVTLRARNLNDAPFQAFAVEDVLALKDELDERRRLAASRMDA
jgi:hypothetical protein